jgi:hypothetical protein
MLYKKFQLKLKRSMYLVMIKFEAEVMSEKEAIKLAMFAIKIIAGKEMKNHEIRWSGRGRPKNG